MHVSGNATLTAASTVLARAKLRKITGYHSDVPSWGHDGAPQGGGGVQGPYAQVPEAGLGVGNSWGACVLPEQQLGFSSFHVRFFLRHVARISIGKP